MLDYVTLLKEKTLTVTPQRLEIVSLLSSNQHINVDELYVLLHNNFPSISLATVYKNINVMLEKLLLSEVQIPNKKNVYELMKEEHCHLMCLECHEILDLKLDITKLIKEAELKSGYSIYSSDLVFSGVCPSCS